LLEVIKNFALQTNPTYKYTLYRLKIYQSSF
jgi:hypothetical protein